MKNERQILVKGTTEKEELPTLNINEANKITNKTVRKNR